MIEKLHKDQNFEVKITGWSYASKALFSNGVGVGFVTTHHHFPKKINIKTF
jgi:hypothetical protein